jgi:hypothetical protein
MALSIPLNPVTWDIYLDGNGNLELTDNDSSIAQDVACSIRTFEGEVWYNNVLGMPYFQAIFGKNPPHSFLTSNIQEQALTCPDVTSVNVVGIGLDGRTLKGVVVVNAPNSPIQVNF